MYRKGIDVSVNNGSIDWAAVQREGIAFAYIKATQGLSLNGKYRLFRDSRFAENMEGASRAGLEIGVYHYLTAKTTEEAEAEAEYFLEAIAPYRDKIGLYAAVDVEESKYLPSDPALLTAIVDIFCRTVEKAGYRPAVYANRNYLQTRFQNRWPLWLALWREPENVPHGFGAAVWQYASDGKVSGIRGEVDMNLELIKQEREDITMAETDNIPSTWAEEAVTWAKDNGMVYGDENGNLKLHDAVTREQMLVFLHRLYQKIGGIE